MAHLTELKDFEPEAIVLHVGHNDLVHHHFHNPHPMQMQDFFPFAMKFVDYLQDHFPSCRVVYSSLFPRTLGPYMGQSLKIEYNKMAAKYGEMVESACTNQGKRFTLNKTLWYSFSDGIEHPVYFKPDGLHLNHIGKEVVVVEWMTKLMAP
jgi:hypothetical protein